jgi:hypothetical protein
MKLNLVKQGSDSFIEGYHKVEYTGGPLNLNNISDNECEFILASEIMDVCDSDDIEKFLPSLLKKLRLNGILVIGGTDIRLFCKHVVNSLINEKEASNIIKQCKSMTNVNSMREYISQLGLKIKTLQITGTHYEITATRESA